ncbi:MAG: B12-binding domain-containing radical SAM protein [Planctomycetes bacterium]|nr:B12-binding domain-containing radical SAM protein [Planctomycetota bacterium]
MAPEESAAASIRIVNLAAGQSHSMAPLGALYVVAALEEAGHQVSFEDYALHARALAAGGPDRGTPALDPDRIARFLGRGGPRILGISTFASLLPFAIAALPSLKRRSPGTIVILGGPGPSATPGEILKCFREVDFVVYGEGEETAVELLDSLSHGTPSLDLIEGLAWRSPGRGVVVNPPRARRRDLDDVPFPAYHHVDLSRYDVVGVIYSRGCPYACTYCDVVSMWKRRNIARSLDNVLAEIRWLTEEKGIRHVAFVDDLFTVDRRRVLAFCEAHGAARERGAGSPGRASWGITTRIDRVDDELLVRMAAAGCVYVFYGVESGSAKILARINKVIPFEATARAVRTSAGLGMYVHTPLLWGFPFETMDDFRETIAFGRYLEHCGGHVFYSLVTPLPATALAEEFRERILFDPSIYSTIIAPGREADLSQVADLIREHPRIFSGFHHFADGLVPEKLALGRSLGIELTDIRLSDLARDDTPAPEVA